MPMSWSDFEDEFGETKEAHEGFDCRENCGAVVGEHDALCEACQEEVLHGDGTRERRRRIVSAHDDIVALARRVEEMVAHSAVQVCAKAGVRPDALRLGKMLRDALVSERGVVRALQQCRTAHEVGFHRLAEEIFAKEIGEIGERVAQRYLAEREARS